MNWSSNARETMSLILNDVKIKNGGDSVGAFVQKVIKTEVFRYARGK